MLLQFMSSVLPMFSYRSFMVSGFTFRFLIPFVFIFVYGVREYSSLILLHIAVQFSQNHLLKRLSFLHCIFSSPLSQIDHKCVGFQLPWWCCGKASACQHRSRGRCGFDPWVRKIPWRRKWQSTPVFLPGISHGQRSLVGYSPWGCKESEMTEQLCTQTRVGLTTSQLLKILTLYQIVLIWSMAPHSSTLAWKIPWMEEPGRLQSLVSPRVRDD